MEINEMEVSGKFTKMQLELLKLFSYESPESEYEEIKELIKRYYLNKARDEMDNFFMENNWGNEKVTEWANQHMRTPYNNAK